MAQPPIYEPGGAPRAMPLPSVDPSSTGAAIARGLGELGGATMDFAQARYESEAGQQSAAFGVASAQARQRIDQAKIDLQQDPAGPAGYQDRVQALVDGEREALFAPLTNGAAQRRAIGDWAQYAGEETVQAHLWERGQLAAKAIDDWQDQANLADQRVATSLDPAAYRLEQAQLASTNAGLAADPEAKRRALDPAQRRLAFSYGLNVASNAPGQLDALLAGPELAMLTPEERQHLETTARVTTTRASAQAAGAASLAAATTEQGLELAAADYRQARPTFNQASALAGQYQAAAAAQAARAQQLEAAGQYDHARSASEMATRLEKGAIEWRGQATEIGAAEQWRAAPPGERQAEINRLAAMPGRTPDQEATLNGLKGQASWVDKLSALDRAAYATGRSAPPLDIADPASIRQRVAAAQAAQARFGGVIEPFQPAELDPLKQMVARGTLDDRVQAARSLAAMGPLAGAALDQVLGAGGDRGLRAAMTLGSLPNHDQLMRDALAGPDALRANPKLLEPELDEEKKPLSAKFDDLFNGETRFALALLPAQQRADILENARNLYAAYAGRAGWTFLHPGAAQQAWRMALGGVQGGTGWAGGLGEWQGHRVVLPVGMPQAELERRLSRASGAEWGAAATNGPAWTSGGAMTAAEARGLVPVRVREGVYALRDGNSFVSTRSNRRFEFDLRKLPGRLHPAAAPDAAPAGTPDPFLSGNF